MRSQLELVQSALDDEPVERGALTGPHQRLVDAWQDRESTTGPADLAALLNQVLRHEAAGEPASARLDVPGDRDGLDRSCLARAGLAMDPLAEGRIRVRPGERWAPAWLRGDPSWIDLAISTPDGISLDDGTWVPSKSRPEREVEIDPAVEQLSHAITYRSRTQAVALRTIALAPAGSSVHVVLPTGSGKSLAGLSPGLLQQDATTVVVVPTIALALDQERHALTRFPGAGLPEELAYYGSLDPEVKSLIRRRLADGTQRLVFTSPEALVQGLAPALHQLARRGGLRYVVVDEAHLVRTWGLDFRPEFQLAASLLEELRQVAQAAGRAPATTVLMTATLSLDGLKLNEALFRGDPSPFVGSTYLRTEPRYLTGEASSEEERLDRVVEAMFRLPRPAIVYTTRKGAAEEIVARMRSAGFGRTVAFHGDTEGSERLDILRAWSGGDRHTSLDVVVGTSAFGLGVDQSDVRSVVHACIPGSVDRYYQEVGRAGRDGYAAVSLLLPYRARDMEEARRIEGATLIGNDKAWARWRAMVTSDRGGERPGEGTLVVDTAAVPEHIGVRTDANRLWNRNTLNLLARSGLLQISALPPPDLSPDPKESEEEWERRSAAAWTRFRDAVAVRVPTHAGNLDRQAIESAISRVRTEVFANQHASLDRMDRLLSTTECWADVFAEEYTFRHQRVTGVAVQHVSPSCSGCPAAHHHGPEGGRAPTPIIPEPTMPPLPRELGPTLAAELHGQGGLVVTYEETRRGGGPERWLADLIRRLVANGVRGLLVPSWLREHPAVLQAHRHAPEHFVLVDTEARGPRPFSVPTLIVMGPRDTPQPTWLPPVGAGPPRIVLMSSGTPDPAKPGAAVAEWRSPVIAVDELVGRI
jgi:ATP-dependent DNA helicase RecQ